MPRRAERPAPLSQMPGALMRGLSGDSVGSQLVPSGKTVSRWAERRMQGVGGGELGVEGGGSFGLSGESSARTLPSSSVWTLVRPREWKWSRNHAARADSPKGGAGMRTNSRCHWRS